MPKSKIAGLFYNVKEQARESVAGRLVHGSIPTWLEGTIFRVGPGIFDLDGGFTVNYYMDGFSVICKFELEEKQIKYSQRLLESEAYTKAKICKRPVFAEFGTRAYPDTTKNIFKRLISTLVPTDLTDNNVSNIYPLEGEIIASSETCLVHSIHPESLVKKEKLNYSKFLPGTMLYTAHPITDSDGVTWNVAMSCIPTCKYHIVRIPPSGNLENSLQQAKILVTVDATRSTALTYLHSFAMTENYIIFMEQPLQMNIIKMAQMGIKGHAVKDSFHWHSELRNRVHVIEKSTGNHLKTLFFTDNPYFVLHYVNAYEENDQIILDMLTYVSAQVLENAELQKLRKDEYSQKDISQMNRFVLPVIWDVKHVSEGMNLVNSDSPYTSLALTVRKGDWIVMTPQPIADPGFELPTINPQYIGKPYQYFYASGIYIPFGHYRNSICKFDNYTDTTKLQRTEHPDDFFGEIYFVPRGKETLNDEGLDEDDGVVLSCVTSSDPQRLDYLLILDGQSFDIIAKVEFDVKFPQTLHGCFVRKSNNSM